MPSTIGIVSSSYANPYFTGGGGGSGYNGSSGGAGGSGVVYIWYYVL